MLGAQSIVWFGVSVAATALAISLLYTRYVRKDAQAVRAGGGFALFAFFLFVFAAGAAVAGYAATQAGR